MDFLMTNASADWLFRILSRKRQLVCATGTLDFGGLHDEQVCHAGVLSIKLPLGHRAAFWLVVDLSKKKRESVWIAFVVEHCRRKRTRTSCCCVACH